MCLADNTLLLCSPGVHHVRLSSSAEQEQQLGPAKKHHRRFFSSDSFFKDALLLNSTSSSTVIGPEERDPDFSCRRVDSRQSSTAVARQDELTMVGGSQTVQASPIKQRRSQSVIPSLSGLMGVDSVQMTFHQSYDHFSLTSARAGVLPPLLNTICENRIVRFEPYVTVRVYEDVAVCKEYLLNYGNSISNGLPITLGKIYHTVRMALPSAVVTDSFTTTAEMHPNLGYRRRFYESCRRLSREQRFAILIEKGGYNEKELWKTQRDLALKDRQIFFGADGGRYFDKELWLKQRRIALRDRRIFFSGEE